MNEGLISKDQTRNILLVEGSDDVQVCYHLLNRYHIKVPQQVEIKDKQGFENLIRTIDIELLGSGPKRIGILADADENLSTRWQSLRDVLIKCDYSTVPNQPDPSGTVINEDEKPPIGIWVMPDNQLPGMLEHFCSALIPANDPLWELAEETLHKVIERERRFIPSHMMKARLHTWLAWQKEPGKPMGQAITKQYLDYQAPNAQLFINWLRRLFEL